MVHLNSTKPIVSKNSFFRPKYLGKVKRFKRTTEPTFSMFPLVIGSNQMGMKLDQYTDKMKKKCLSRQPEKPWNQHAQISME